MNTIKIKYFPANIIDYFIFFLVNFLFFVFFYENLFEVANQNSLQNKKKELLLLIPKNSLEYEEKKDLIFNQLSLNTDILSVDKMNTKKVKKILSNILQNIEIEESLIPDVYKLKVKKNSEIDIDKLNIKIFKISKDIKIFFTKQQKKDTLFIFYKTLIAVFFFFFFFNHFFTKLKVKKIKKYLELCRAFGMKDIVLIINLNIGYFLLTFASFILSQIVVLFFLARNLNEKNVLNDYISLTFIVFVVCFFLIFINLTLQLKFVLKRLL